MAIADLARRAAKLAIDNSPHILTALGVAGTITTAVLAGKASFEAADLIRLKEADDENRGIPVPAPQQLMKDRVNLVWRLYIPPALMAGATIACIVGADRVSASRAAGIATAYTLLERNTSSEKEKLVEKLGLKKSDDARGEAIQQRIDESNWQADPALAGMMDADIVYDAFGGQYFQSSAESLRAAVNAINNTINHVGYATLADLYRYLDIECPSFAESIGWNSDRLIDIHIDGAMLHDTKPIIVMSFRNDPLPDYGRFH